MKSILGLSTSLITFHHSQTAKVFTKQDTLKKN